MAMCRDLACEQAWRVSLSGVPSCFVVIVRISFVRQRNYYTLKTKSAFFTVKTVHLLTTEAPP